MRGVPVRHEEHCLRRVLCLWCLTAAGGIGAALAQEPVNADSATQPTPGHATFKQQFRFSSLSLEEGPRDRRRNIQDLTLLSTVNLGLTTDTALSLRVPVVFRRETFDVSGHVNREEGVGDVTALGKWRFWRNDTAALDTQRASLLAGAQIRTGDSPFTSDAYNPILGLAYTQIAGRHGLNGSLQWMFTTGGVPDPVMPGMTTADLLRYDGAYLYRLSPAAYTADTQGAWYAVAEVNGLYETNGDNQLFLAPGLMYEARTWTFELSVQVPVWQDLARRPEARYTLVAGLRFSF
jgi:hypothetical protein